MFLLKFVPNREVHAEKSTHALDIMSNHKT